MQQAVDAITTGRGAPETGKIVEMSGPRRTFLGLALAAPLLALPAMAHASPEIAAWDRAEAAWRRAEDVAETYYKDVFGPACEGWPPAPSRTERVGTDKFTGKPLYKTWDPAELKGEEPFFLTQQWRRARDRWMAWSEEADRYDAAVGYSQKEAEHDRLLVLEFEAKERLISLPAPHAAALALKMQFIILDRHPELSDEQEAVIAADIARLGGRA